MLARQLSFKVYPVLNTGNCCADGLGFIDPHDISACENLLEAYFMQIDFLLSRLKVLDERIDDSESTIEIELDHRSKLVLCSKVSVHSMPRMLTCLVHVQAQ